MTHFSRFFRASRVAGLCALLLLLASTFYADTNVDATSKYSWGANIGWLNWAGNVTNGASFDRFASGFVYSANVGWINLGDGTPNNGIAYSNTSATDFGVNLNRTSDPNYILMSGKAWGANIGWINFDVEAQTGASERPRIDKSSGIMLGYAWSPNLGWLSLNASPVATVKIHPRNAANQWQRYE